MLTKYAVADEAAGLTEFWSQRVLTEANGNLFKVAKGTRSANWHAHDDQDETFLLLAGHLTVQLRDGDVHLSPGDLLVIPRGVEHCPRVDGDEEAHFLLIGPAVTSNAAGGKPDWSHAGGTPTSTP
ncbi:mannose-6-phosphate isomerase [Paractinoplanes abujensis]|uniref:Quercetin dioxygenase-like cupin family protein n=1 Tax=Paractinoplanes abujensis TaxID=882441 RepID=A0A7W7G5T0_9ACTN|nr:cupin domain-containing protein [Actinoplanes abujensis]MBB4697312.1 quercetin dioxygenase-like cupin family protein [Actinoplanes abujensis]GID18212.1 mannose-6-phosphate isomerase [Actinoplanes abujensis]